MSRRHSRWIPHGDGEMNLAKGSYVFRQAEFTFVV